MHKGTLSIKTSQHIELIDITAQVNTVIAQSGCRDGICYLYTPHTTSAITINEGADPAVRQDLIAALKHIVPSQFDYKHLEGNSPSHVMASLFGCSQIVFVVNGAAELGTWQKIFFCEFDGPRSRTMQWRIIQS